MSVLAADVIRPISADLICGRFKSVRFASRFETAHHVQVHISAPETLSSTSNPPYVSPPLSSALKTPDVTFKSPQSLSPFPPSITFDHPRKTRFDLKNLRLNFLPPSSSHPSPSVLHRHTAMFPCIFNNPRPQAPAFQVASSALASPKHIARPYTFPFEGKLFDDITISNFVDLDKYKFTAQLSKSLPSNALSNLLDADLPVKLTATAKLGTIWFDGVECEPVGKVAANVRLLDLGASDSRQKGFLKFKAAARTNGKADHGFEIDRKVQLFNMSSTTLYGNVLYRTTNKSEGEWKTSSSFGIHQDFNIKGYKFAARVGLTPEGDFVSDLRL